MKFSQVSAAVILALMLGTALAAVRGDSAMYVGGTLQLEEKTNGKLDLSSATVAVFNSKKGTFEIPYKNITSLEYGQKAGRRVGVALAVNPLALFSKKRKHYLSITYTDAQGSNQGVVLELSKGKVRPAVEVLEQRSGQKVEFESDDARKHYGG
jgi:hypothetical protein